MWLWGQIKKGVRMDFKLMVIGWLILATSIIYWDQHRRGDDAPTSVCHDAPIKFYKERARCTECGKYCEVRK